MMERVHIYVSVVCNASILFPQMTDKLVWITDVMILTEGKCEIFTLETRPKRRKMKPFKK